MAAKFLEVILRFRKLIITVIVVAGFFSYYNIFLVDYTLDNLSFSLEQTAMAYDLKDVGGLDMVMTKTISKEIMPYDINSRNTANLEYAKSIINTGKSFCQLDYIKVALKSVIDEKEKQRGGFLTFLDRVNRFLNNGLMQLACIPAYFSKAKLSTARTQGTEIDLFEKMREAEKGKDLHNLLINYKELASRYSEAKGIALVKLRLAYAYQQLGNYDKAAEIYKSIAESYFPQREARIASIFLRTLKEKDKLLARAKMLTVKSNELAGSQFDAEKQKVFYEIGTIYMQLMNVREAIKFFKQVVAIDPAADIAQKSRFNVAWLHKQVNGFKNSLNEFTKIISEKPLSDLALNSRYQMTDVYHAQGKYEKAINGLSKMAEKYQDNSGLAGLYLFEAGGSSLYDLNDAGKAEAFFSHLNKEYSYTDYARYFSQRASVEGLPVPNAILRKFSEMSIDYLVKNLKIPNIEYTRPSYERVALTALNTFVWLGITSNVKMVNDEVLNKIVEFSVKIDKFTIAMLNLGERAFIIKVNGFSAEEKKQESDSKKSNTEKKKQSGASKEGDTENKKQESDSKKSKDQVSAADFIIRVNLNSTEHGNMDEEMKYLFAQLRKFSLTGATKIPIEFSAEETFVIKGNTYKGRIWVERRGDEYRLVMDKNFLKKVTADMGGIPPTEGDLALIANNPLKAPEMFRIRNKAETTAQLAHRRNPLVPEDAYRHTLWAFLLTKAFGKKFAEEVGSAHESGPDLEEKRNKGIQDFDINSYQDFHNNEVGRSYAMKGYAESRILYLVMTDPAIIKDNEVAQKYNPVKMAAYRAHARLEAVARDRP